LRQTNTVSSSSGPITYSSPGPSCIATNDAGGNCGCWPRQPQPGQRKLSMAVPADLRETTDMRAPYLRRDAETANLATSRDWASLGYREKG
jgi:hypothetical protein